MTAPARGGAAVPSHVGPDSPHASDSAAQRDAEREAIAVLSRDIGLPLVPRRLDLGDASCVNVDGFHDGPPAVLAEVFAHQGPLKGGQRHKLISDAFKLLAASKVLFASGAHVMLVLTDDQAAAGVRAGWRGLALKALGVEVRTVVLPARVSARVRLAQERQRMVNEKRGADE